MSTISVIGKILNENEIQQCLKELRKLVVDDGDLKKFRTDDAFLLRYLHACAFDISAVLERMKNYYNLMIRHPSFFATAPPLEMKPQLEVKDKALSEERDNSGRAIFIFKLEKMDVTNSSPAEQARILELWMELIMDNPQIQAHGLSVILDMNGYSWKVLKWFTPTNVTTSSKKMTLYPVKEIVLHVVNTSFLLNASIKLIYPFLNDTVKGMFKFHYNDWSSLHKYISPDVLPAEYGGTGPDYDFDKCIQSLFDQNDVIAEKLKHNQAILKELN